ncbi:MAG: hypothetical protein C0603_02160 [Denitrovibrio sp.]|nr:MAG: hypothetical protein C0603_02160 [Denitrovibrio sp.]
MALLELIPENDQDQFLKNVFSVSKETFGFIPEALKLYGIAPEILATTLKAFEAYRETEGMSPILFIYIRFAYANTMKFPYCINLNTLLLKALAVPADKVEEAKSDWKKLPMSDNEINLVDFALKVAINPDDVSKSDIEALKELGWTEKQIFTASDQAARMNYASTLIRAFKLEIDKV